MLDRERQTVADERKRVAEERTRILARESHVTEREAILRKRLDDRLNEKLREARAEVDRVVAQVKTKAEALVQKAEQRPLSTGEIGQLRVQGRSALDTVAQPLGPATPDPNVPLDRVPEPGDDVFVPAFGSKGRVTSVSGKHAEVDVRGKRMKVAWRDLQRAAGGRAPGARPTGPRERETSPSGGGGVTTPSSAGLASAVRELMVIGKTVDQATDEAEKFLDAALMSDSRRLRVVHGHGTGRLREAMTKFFREHPLVASVAPAPDNEGGNGATIVELKD